MYSGPSNKSWSASNSNANYYQSRQTSNPNASASSTATQLPFVESYQLICYATKELEGMSFTIFQTNDLLEGNDIEYPEQIELNLACREFRRFLPSSKLSMLDWLSDLRHLSVHRKRMTALAVCKTFTEAASFAMLMGYKALGSRLKDIATEMDWCRSKMAKSNTNIHKYLPEDLKTEISQRLKGVLKAAQEGRPWEIKDDWGISNEVSQYTLEQKLKENPWINRRVCRAWRCPCSQSSRSFSTLSSPYKSFATRGESISWRTSSADADPRKIWIAPKPLVYVPPYRRRGCSPRQRWGT